MKRSFPAEVTSVAAARAFAAEQLRAEQAELVETMKLIVSELATNAVLHATSTFEVAIERVRGGVRLEVTDGGDGQPQMRELGPTSTSGRGLHIVETLADAWGWSDNGVTKTVWAFLGRSAPSGDGEPSDARVSPGRPA